jgi:hypothetical protein
VTDSSNRGGELNTAGLIAQYEAEDIPLQRRHARRKEMWVLMSGTLIAAVTVVLGLYYTLNKDTDPAVRTIAAGWVGMVLGQVKGIWGSDTKKD